MRKKPRKQQKLRLSATEVFGPQKQLTMGEAFQGKCEYNRNSKRYKNITKRLPVFGGSSNTLNSIVENVEFQELIKLLDPRYPLPSRALLDKELDKVLVDLKASIYTYLAAAQKVNLCADIWSRRL